MDLIQAMKNRVSIRKYRNEPVTDEMLQTIFEAARWAPSWGNDQIWRLIIVRDPETKSKLADTCKSVTKGGKNAATEAVRTAPVVIVACGLQGHSGCYWDEERIQLMPAGTPAVDVGEWLFLFDLGLFMQNVTLIAHSLGLGTVHVGMIDGSKVARILGIPENITAVELVPLGWPADVPPPRPRKDISKFVFHERYPE